MKRLGVTFEEVFQEELEYVRQRWETDGISRREPGWPPSTENDLVGLAFSGGGIRSATINLGIAQALHRRGVFRHVDYMSTVSGGGYLGSSISVAMRRHPGREDEDLAPGTGEFPFPCEEAATDPGVNARLAPPDDAHTAALEGPQVETAALTWLRNNSNYLLGRGFMDWARVSGSVLRGILVNLLSLLPLLMVLAVLLAWLHGSRLSLWETAGFEAAAAAATAFRFTLLAVGFFVLLTLVHTVLVRVYKVFQQSSGLPQESSVQSRGQVELSFALVLLSIGAAASVEAFPYLLHWFHSFEGDDLRAVVAAAGTGGVIAAFTAASKALSSLGGLRHLLTPAGRGASGPERAGNVEAVASPGWKPRTAPLLLLGLVGLIIPLLATLYLTEYLVYPVEPPGTAAETAESAEPPGATPFYLSESSAYEPVKFEAWSAVLRHPVWWLPATLLLIVGGGWSAAVVGRLMPPSRLRPFLTGAALVAGVAYGFFLLAGVSHSALFASKLLGVDGIRPDVLLLTIAAVVFVFSWMAIDINLSSVHGLYRDRLAIAYLIGRRKKREPDGSFAHGPDGGFAEEVYVERDLNLGELCGGTPPEYGRGRLSDEEGQRGRDATCRPSSAPYHIINTALNLQGSRDPMLRDRNSDFFMFSKLYYGGRRTGYCSTANLEGIFPQMDLPTAMTISAAAASPNAGRMTHKPLVALMTLLNIRLGYWVPHPGRLSDWLSRKKIYEPRQDHRWRWRIPPSALLREMFSRVDERHRWVNLSDGGHIENTGLYELLRRRCRFVICGDGEADASMAFGGLATLLRYARIDMGIEIELQLDDLRLGDDGRSHQHAALGRILYPARHREVGAYEPGNCTSCGAPLEQSHDEMRYHCPNGRPEIGYLLYIKSSYSGDEDEAIREYRARNSAFPHESTADQFFDEGQFEAYRALGFHMADGLFPPSEPGRESGPYRRFDQFTRWFRSLRTDLAPRRSPKHAALREQLQRIEEQLVLPKYRAYFYELYPELNHGDAKQEEVRDFTEMIHVFNMQIALIREAFRSLNLDQPRNWQHDAYKNWRTLFTAWAKSDTFKNAYRYNVHRYSDRFRDFCERSLRLPAAN